MLQRQNVAQFRQRVAVHIPGIDRRQENDALAVLDRRVERVPIVRDGSSAVLQVSHSDETQKPLILEKLHQRLDLGHILARIADERVTRVCRIVYAVVDQRTLNVVLRPVFVVLRQIVLFVRPLDQIADREHIFGTDGLQRVIEDIFHIVVMLYGVQLFQLGNKRVFRIGIGGFVKVGIKIVRGQQFDIPADLHDRLAVIILLVDFFPKFFL